MKPYIIQNHCARHWQFMYYVKLVDRARKHYFCLRYLPSLLLSRRTVNSAVFLAPILRLSGFPYKPALSQPICLLLAPMPPKLGVAMLNLARLTPTAFSISQYSRGSISSLSHSNACAHPGRVAIDHGSNFKTESHV